MRKQSVTVGSRNRIQFFDHVRNITMLCVVLYHAVKAYSTTTPDHPVHDANPILFADYVRWIFDVFMMPVFFFVAGFFAVPSLKNKSLGSFILGKIKRLGVPWLAVMVSVGGFFVFGATAQSATQQIVSFGDVLIDMLKGFNRLKESNFGDQFHIWFLSLLLFSFVVFGLVYKTFENRFNSFINKNSDSGSGKSAFSTLLIFGTVISIGYYIAIIFFPRINDWVYLSYLTFEPSKSVSYLGCFLLGIYGYSKNWFTDNVKMGNSSFWTAILVLSLAGFLISGKEILVGRIVPDNFPKSQLIIFAIARSFLCLSVLVLIVSLASRYWRNSSHFTKKLSDNSYHIYIIHMFILLAIQAALVNWQSGPTWIKLMIVFFSTVTISYVISEYVTNRFPKITVAVLMLISISLVLMMNPYRYERRFDQRQVEIKNKAANIKTDYLSLRNEAISSFKESLKNPSQGLVEAFEKLSLAHQNQKDDYEIMSYLGRAAVMIVKYRAVKNPLEFIVYNVKGFKWLDKAVENDPDNVIIRLNRAIISSEVSESLNRRKCAKLDFEYLAKKIEENPAIDKPIKEQVFSNLEKIYEKGRKNSKVN